MNGLVGKVIEVERNGREAEQFRVHSCDFVAPTGAMGTPYWYLLVSDRAGLLDFVIVSFGREMIRVVGGGFTS